MEKIEKIGYCYECSEIINKEEEYIILEGKLIHKRCIGCLIT